MIDEQLHDWLVKHGSKPVTFSALRKVLEVTLQPVAALKAANHGLQERCHLLEIRILELEANRAIATVPHDA
jgi:hypothetical protein